MQQFIGNLSALTDTAAISEDTTNSALVTGRLPVSVTPTRPPHLHPRTPDQHVFRSEHLQPHLPSKTADILTCHSSETHNTNDSSVLFRCE